MPPASSSLRCDSRGYIPLGTTGEVASSQYPLTFLTIERVLFKVRKAPFVQGEVGVRQILIIDDEPSIHRLFSDVLKGAGYEPVAASSAREGLRVLRERPVDLVITDILMPDMDGLEVTRNVRREFPRVKIIAMTGGQQAIDYCQVARLLGAHDTLIKPIASERLLEAVARLLAP
jgi:CheY-like chemotaxis protein